MTANCIPALRIIYSESTGHPISDDDFLVERDGEKLLRLLTILENEQEFFTLGCHNKILIVPFEHRQFNVISSSELKFLSNINVNIENATDVLRTYGDAYENLGFSDVFPGVHLL